VTGQLYLYLYLIALTYNGMVFLTLTNTM
jgi:hypothetical protein